MEFQLDQAFSVLERTPPTLTVLLQGLPDPWLHGDEGGETWSPFVVVGHLIHGERTDWVPRARIILDHGEDQVFEPFDRFAQLDQSRGKSLADLLKEFATLRARNLETVRGWNLGPADFARRGRHPEFGPVTLGELLATWVAHDLGHIGQIVRTMASQYRDEVGPWRAYLRVLGG